MSNQSRSQQKRTHQKRTWYFLTINLLCAVIVPIFFTLFGAVWDHLLSFLGVAAVLTLIDRAYGNHLYWSGRFVLFLFVQIIVSNLALAWLVIQPKLKLDPGIVAVPLTVRTNLEITAVASSVTLTPGTLAIDLHTDEKGRHLLYIHSFQVGDPDRVRLTIKNGVERRIARISGGATT